MTSAVFGDANKQVVDKKLETEKQILEVAKKNRKADTLSLQQYPLFRGAINER